MKLKRLFRQNIISTSTFTHLQAPPPSLSASISITLHYHHSFIVYSLPAQPWPSLPTLSSSINTTHNHNDTLSNVKETLNLTLFQSVSHNLVSKMAYKVYSALFYHFFHAKCRTTLAESRKLITYFKSRKQQSRLRSPVVAVVWENPHSGAFWYPLESTHNLPSKHSVNLLETSTEGCSHIYLVALCQPYLDVK